MKNQARALMSIISASEIGRIFEQICSLRTNSHCMKHYAIARLLDLLTMGSNEAILHKSLIECSSYPSKSRTVNKQDKTATEPRYNTQV